MANPCHSHPLPRLSTTMLRLTCFFRPACCAACLPQVKLEDQNLWVAENASTMGVQYFNCIITDSVPGMTYVPGLQLTLLFRDPYTPFPAITWVSNANQLVQALQDQKTANIFLLQNISVPHVLWPEDGITLRRDLAIGGWPARTTVLDWQGVTDVIDLNGKKLEIREWHRVVGQGTCMAQGHLGTSLSLCQYLLNIFALHHQRSSLEMGSSTARRQPVAHERWPGQAWDAASLGGQLHHVPVAPVVRQVRPGLSMGILGCMGAWMRCSCRSRTELARHLMHAVALLAHLHHRRQGTSLEMLSVTFVVPPSEFGILFGSGPGSSLSASARLVGTTWVSVARTTLLYLTAKAPSTEQPVPAL